MALQIALFLGAGKNNGAASVTSFKANNYKVAAVARNPVPEIRETADLVISADFSDPSCIAGIFEKVEKELGTPSVVIYNGQLSKFPCS
jgi:NAD(P)-dependent dehydrogenase (short-subunit alcohol dehydrogenase family)